jgi:hypothetical protein
MNKTSSSYYLYPLPNLPRQLAGEGAESKAFPPWGKRERGLYRIQ